MDVLIETTVGDAQVSVRGGCHRRGTDHQIGMAAAMPASGTPDAKEVASFLDPLNDLSAADLDDLAVRLPATPLPAGYRHFRLFDALTGEQSSASFVYEAHRSLTLHDVVFAALNNPFVEVSAWKRTDWLPDMIPGVLDLEIAVGTRPRTRPFRLRL